MLLSENVDTPPAASTAFLDLHSVQMGATPEITLADSSLSGTPPAAPGGAAIASVAHGHRRATPRRTALQVYCSSTSFRLIAAQLERAFETSHPNINLILHVDTDRNCVGHLLMGTADVAMIGSKLSDREQSRGLDTMVLGHRVMVPIMHPENPVRSVSYDDFEAIRSGRLTGWSGLGGKDFRIEPVCMVPPQRPDLAAKAMQFSSKAASCTAFLHSHQEILGYVANNVRALGLVSKTSADHVRIVKTLQVDQIMPTLEFYLKGAWRFGNTFRAAHYKDPEAATRSWLEFLKSKSAQVVLKRVMTLEG